MLSADDILSLHYSPICDSIFLCAVFSILHMFICVDCDWGGRHWTNRREKENLLPVKQVSTSCQWPQNTYKNNNIIQNSFIYYIVARSMAARATCTREMSSFAHLNATGDRVGVCGVSYTIRTAKMIFFPAISCRSIDIIDCIGYTGRRCLCECSSSASLHWNGQMTKKKKWQNNFVYKSREQLTGARPSYSDHK